MSVSIWFSNGCFLCLSSELVEADRNLSKHILNILPSQERISPPLQATSLWFFSYFSLTFFSILVHILILGKGWESNGFFLLIHFLHFVCRQMWRQTAKRNQSWQPYGLSAYSSFAKLVIVWWSFSVKLKPIEKLNWGMNTVWQIQNFHDVMWELFLDLSWYNNDYRLIPKHVLSISVQQEYLVWKG